ncbi:hypothetical protein RYX36_034244, partial [Vicia faba]
SFVQNVTRTLAQPSQNQGEGSVEEEDSSFTPFTLLRNHSSGSLANRFTPDSSYPPPINLNRTGFLHSMPK